MNTDTVIRIYGEAKSQQDCSKFAKEGQFCVRVVGIYSVYPIYSENLKNRPRKIGPKTLRLIRQTLHCVQTEGDFIIVFIVNAFDLKR